MAVGVGVLVTPVAGDVAVGVGVFVAAVAAVGVAVGVVAVDVDVGVKGGHVDPATTKKSPWFAEVSLDGILAYRDLGPTGLWSFPCGDRFDLAGGRSLGTLAADRLLEASTPNTDERRRDGSECGTQTK